MGGTLVTYLQDHLAGARFAVTLLEEIKTKNTDSRASELASSLLSEIEQDRSVLETLLAQQGADTSLLKEAGAWIAQKASKAKLDVGDPVGIFEAIELLSLGVLGKRALWNTLLTLAHSDSSTPGMDLEELIARAERQYEVLESLRRSLACSAFGEKS